MCIGRDEATASVTQRRKPRASVSVARILSAVAICAASTIHAQAKIEAAFGIGWDVRGAWSVDGTSHSIHSGDAVAPGSLLRANGPASPHSITILLPDGQRILYECFSQSDCEHGFRVPALDRRPESFALEFLGRVGAVFADRQHPEIEAPSNFAEDETAALTGSGNRIQIGGLAAKLQNGRYTYSVRAFGSAALSIREAVLEKISPVVTLRVPGPGLFSIRITDALGRPRIDLLVAALSAHQQFLLRQFQQARSLLAEWNENYQGWPIHAFHRAYLASVMLGISPIHPSLPKQAAAANANTAQEPSFSPRPGVVRGDTNVSLHCDTPGATIHYTIDNSEPFPTSPLYRSPIVVKGTELTIKAFATAPGKKDSPVVTGIFRVEQ